MDKFVKGGMLWKFELFPEILPVFAIKHIVTSSVHADAPAVMTCELLFFTTGSQLQSKFKSRTLGIPGDVPVVLSQNKGIPTGLGLSCEIGPSVVDCPFVHNIVELYPNTSTTDKENVYGNNV